MKGEAKRCRLCGRYASKFCDYLDCPHLEVTHGGSRPSRGASPRAIALLLAALVMALPAMLMITVAARANLVTAGGQTVVSLWLPSDTPGTIDAADPQAVELGVQFQAAVSGKVTGISFYKASTNTGTHIGNLWTTGGTNLASVTFTGESASGWQQMLFSAPVAITAGTTYIVSYHTTSGHYSADNNYFLTSHANGVLTAPATSLVSPGNGVFSYNAASVFPNQTFQGSNYWVDVSFVYTPNPQVPVAVSFPANPTAIYDTLGAGGFISAPQVATNTGGSFTGQLAITGQSDTSPSALTALSGPTVVAARQITSADDGTQTVAVQATENGTSVSGTLTMDVGPPPPDPASAFLPSDRNASANWRMAGLQSVGGIPNRTVVCATVSPIGGGQDDTTNIQNAINGCPSGQVVSLASGTFTVGDCHQVFINKSVTVRGAAPGAGGTLIQRTDGASIGVQGGNCTSPHFVMGPNEFDNSLSGNTNLATDAVAGSDTIQVASTSSFSVGQIVLLDESSNLSWQTDWAFGGQVWATPDRRFSFNGHNPALPNDQAGGQPPNFFCNDGCDRYIEEMKQIAAVGPGPCPGVNCTIRFDDPVMISYRTSLSAHLSRFSQTFTTFAGLENMTLRNADLSDVRMVVCAYCWVKNVEDTISANGTIWIVSGFRDQVEGVYDHTGAWPTSGGAGYNWTLDEGTSEALIENSISMLNNKPMVMRKGGSGSVIAYNYVDDIFGFSEGPNIESGLNASHWSGAHHVLFEGNWSFSVDGDGTWGSSPYQTYYRNQLTGYRTKFNDYINNVIYDDISGTPSGCCYPLRAAQLASYYYWHSFIGNVMGTAGHTDAAHGWIYQSYVFNSPAPAIFSLGGEANDTAFGNGGDPEILSDIGAAAAACVSTTGDKCPVIRHGNYDYFNNAVVWDPNNANHTLPDSFYLNSKPAFFNAGSGYTWPWVTPTGTPQVQSGPTTATCTANLGGRCSGLPAKARFDNGTLFVQP